MQAARAEGNTIQRAKSRAWWIMLLRGSAALGLGLVLFQRLDTLSLLLHVLGAYAIVDGLLLGVSTVMDGSSDRRRLTLLRSAVSILSGSLILSRPVLSVTLHDLVLVYTLAVQWLVVGRLNLRTALSQRQELARRWALFLSGVLALVLAVLVGIAPWALSATLISVIAMLALVMGIALLGVAWRWRGISQVGVMDKQFIAAGPH